MAKAKKRSRAPKAAAAGLPVCVAMVLCDQVVTGNDGTATIVRIVDTIGVPHDDNLQHGHFVELNVTLFVCLKAGDSRGPIELVVNSVDPSRKGTKVGSVSVKMEGPPESGTNLRSPLRVRWAGEGLYWLELVANGKRIARTPVKLNVGTAAEVKAKWEQAQAQQPKPTKTRTA